MSNKTSAAQRFVVFQSLYDASQSRDNDWEQLIALFSKGKQAAQRAQLDQLAERFASGQQLMMEELRQGGLFYEWELRFMQLGMAVGNLGRVYLRLAEHYRLLNAFYQRLRRFLLVFGGVAAGLALGVPLLALLAGVDRAAAVQAAVFGVLPLLLLGVAAGACWWQPAMRRLCSKTAYRLPGLGRALAQYQSYHFINHLAECLAAGFPINQALRQSARRLPETPVKACYVQLAREVEQGQRFSAALIKSGILDGVALPSMAGDTDARDVPARLSLAIHQTCERQSRFWSLSLPGLLLGLVPYILLVNAWFLGA